MADGGGKGVPAATVTPLRAAVPCPRCGRPSGRAAYPFCSARCADVDLNAWLGGHYAIAAVEEDQSVPETASTPLDKPETRQ